MIHEVGKDIKNPLKLCLNLHDIPAMIICDDRDLFNELTKELSHFRVEATENFASQINVYFRSELSTKLNLKLMFDKYLNPKEVGRVLFTEEIVNYTDLSKFNSYFFAKKKWKLQEAVILILNQLGLLLRLKMSLNQRIAVFHGASLAFHDQGILLLGQSGAGKTSLSFQCVRNGFQYFSDEDSFIIHEPELHDFYLLGFQRRLRLCQEILNLLGVKNMPETTFKSFGDEGIVYDPREEFPAVYGKNVQLQGIVILNNHHRNQKVEIDEIPSSHALATLMNYFEAASTENGGAKNLISQYNRNGFNLISALVKEFQIYQINYNFHQHFATLPFFIKKALLLEVSN